MNIFDKVLPKDWKWVTFEKIQASNQKAIVSGPFGSNIGRKFFVEFGVPVIRGNNLTIGTERFIDDGFVFITEKKAEEFSNCEAVSGDLVFTAAGTLGQVGLIPEKTKYPKYIISNKQMRARVDPKVADKLFVFYWLSSPEMVEYIEQRNTGSSVPLINLSILRSLPIPLPPLPTQRRIAEILGRLDDKIEVNRRINRTLEAMAQALYKHWFVDFGPFQDREFTESELGLIPEGWKVGSLGQIARNLREGVDPTALQPDVPYIGLADMPKGSITLATWGIAGDSISGKSLMKQGQFLFGKLRPYFKKVGVAPVDGVCSTDILVIEPKQQSFYGLILCQLFDQEFIDYTESVSDGTRMPRVNWNMMAKYPMILPPSEVAQQFSQIIDRWVKVIIKNVHENRALTTTCDYLLPKLLSGEITV